MRREGLVSRDRVRRSDLRRNRGRKGAELIEFTLVLAPLLAGITVLVDAGWAVFSTSTLQRAVRVGVTYGKVATASQLPSGCLTDNVKSVVQQNAFGLLAGTAGLNQIKVNYLQPPAPNSGGPNVDVSSTTTADYPGNIIQVSVANYPLIPLVARIVNWNTAPDSSSLTTSVYSAGMIEPNSDIPCVGSAP